MYSGLFRLVAFAGIAAIAVLLFSPTLGPLPGNPIAVPETGACSERSPLQPRVAPGPPWEQHRHWLEGVPLADQTRYVIVNESENRAYLWDFWGNEGGRSRFGIRTRWTWLNRGWDEQQWALYFGCNERTVSATVDFDR